MFCGYQRNAGSGEADGRVKIGQCCSEVLLEGKSQVLFSHFALCLVEELLSARAPPAVPAGTNAFFLLLALVLKKNQLKRGSKQINRITIRDLGLKPPPNVSQDYWCDAFSRRSLPLKNTNGVLGSGSRHRGFVLVVL